MKKNFFASFVVAIIAIISVLATSCDSTYLGTEDDLIKKVSPTTPDPTPDPDATIALENVDINAKFMPQTFTLTSYDYYVKADYVSYVGSVETSRVAVNQSLKLNVIFTIKDVYVSSEKELETVSVKANAATEAVDSISTARFGNVITRSFDHSFTFDQNEQTVAAAKEQWLECGDTIFPHAQIQGISFKEAKSVKDEALCNKDSLVANVSLYFNVDIKIDREVKSRAVDAVETYTVEVPYRRIYKTGYVAPTDEYIKTIVLNYTDVLTNGTREMAVTTAEIWSVSGQKNEKTEKFSVPYSVTSPAPQTIYSKNASYKTVGNGMSNKSASDGVSGNWTVTSRKQNYSSTASNGLNPFNNVYTVNDAKVVYKNKEAIVEFPFGNWTITEGNSTISNPTNSNAYDVYTYVNNINYVYTITSDSKSGNAKAQASIYVEKTAPKTIPDSWGKIIGAGISAVPSDDLGESTNVAKKCLTIRTEKGAVAVVFDWNNSICAVNSILNGYFVEGSFDANYNSGYFTTSTNRGSYALGKWAPAKAMDLSNRIAYYNGSNCVRNVPFTTLKMWNWANGQSTVVSGYTFQVSDNGTLTVKFNGKTVLSIR